MEMRADRDKDTGAISVTGTVTEAEYNAVMHTDRLVSELASRVREKLVATIAERFLEEHLQDVLAEINPIAVANLAIARIAASVGEQLMTTTWTREARKERS